MVQHEFDPLDTVLLELTDLDSTTTPKEVSPWRIRNAVEGVQIFGGIGSGKSSGSGRMLALKYLSAGFGGLVLTAKPDERDVWWKYCEIAGCLNDLIIVEPGGDNFFNFLDYEAAQAKGGNSLTENIVQVLKTVIKASEDKNGGKGEDPFWETALDMLMFNLIDLCKIAHGTVSIQMMYDIMQGLPRQNDVGEGKSAAFRETYNAAVAKVKAQIKAWEGAQSQEFQAELKTKSSRAYDDIIGNAVPEARMLKFIHQFFNEELKHLSEKTRSIIDFSFSGFLFRLLRDPVYSLFCHHPSTFTPEDCWNGKIILINLPVKVYHKLGRDSQIMFKYIWQRAMEKRPMNGEVRPVFLWADEAQNFLHEHDADFQATARSSRIATVYISQNLSNYHANMGGNKFEHKVKSFLGTLGTKFFHANADIETNQYASELIGDSFFRDLSTSTGIAGGINTSKTKSVVVDRIVRAEQFAQLRTGGGENQLKVEGYVHVQGNTFNMPQYKKNHLKALFIQNYKPTNPNQ